jgi:DNA-binding transcriptional MerR regulator
MTGKDRLLTIGVFAHRSRLSIKALRLYDKSGLLTPADVDPGTGYRRYRESQLLRARLIVMMRRAGVPLAQVAEIVAAPGASGADLLAGYWSQAERRFSVQRELVSRLQTSLLSGASAVPVDAYDFQQREVPAQVVLTEKRSLRITELKKWLPDAMYRLAEAAGQHGGLSGELFVVYHGEVNEDSDGPIEACAPARHAAERALASGITARVEAAHQEAYVTITRAEFEYPQILSAFDAVAHWIATTGRIQAGPPREVYRRDVSVAAAAPAQPVCDIAFPVRSTVAASAMGA